jgi:Fe-S-cluster containining protein
MQCGRGCAQCCHGLFDISLPDALLLAEGYRSLPLFSQKEVRERALNINAQIVRECRALESPYLLNAISQEKIDDLADMHANARCPFLSELNACLIYEQRPLACRLEGIPMVDCADGLFGDWCKLNFRTGVSPEIIRDL